MTSNLPDDARSFKIFFSIIFTFVIVFCVFAIFILSSCNSIPEIVRAADDIFDDAVKVTVDKAALQKDTNLNISIGLKNKED